MAKPGATGITRIIHATNYSMKGLSSAWRHEAAFRQELLLIVLLMPLAFFVGDSLNQILLLMVISWLVVIVEILNSAIEAVVDRMYLFTRTGLTASVLPGWDNLSSRCTP